MSPRTLPALVAFLLGLALPLEAQIALINTASSPPAVFQGTVGPDIAIDNVNFKVGTGSASRGFTPANASYLPTGWAMDPTLGFTIQWWYRPALATAFGYILADGDMVSPLGGYSGGRFRVFQSGACYCPTYTPTNTGGLTLRGVPNEAAVVGSPLTNLADPNGWIHLAVRYDPALNTIDWLINGTVASSTLQSAGPFNWQGVNLDIMGDRSSTGLVGDGNYDDFRIYAFARSDADILADYQVNASGNGPSGLPNTPDIAYYEADLALNTHVCVIGTNMDPLGLHPRRVTAGTLIEWGGNAPALPGVPASCLVNLWPGGIDPGCSSQPLGFVGIALCHAYSAPPGPALIFPDGLGLGTLGVGIGVPGPYVYGGPAGPATLALPLPSGFLSQGDWLVLQFLSIDASYPGSLGASNVAHFNHVDPLPGPHAHIEARGNGAIQVYGFWEIRNTGSVDITQVILDCTPLPANTGLSPSGALNTGGNLAAGTSYRYNTDLITGLQGVPPGYTGSGTFTVTVGTVTSTAYRTLQFDFNDFTATIDDLIFDCDSAPHNSTGATFAGMNVTVTFADTTVLTGTLAVDPLDPTAAQVDL